MGKRDVGKERYWRRRIGKQERSGLSVRAFCKREKIPEHRFYWWKRELKARRGSSRRRQKAASKSAATVPTVPESPLVPIHVSPGPTIAPIEIVLDQPARICVSTGCDLDLLAQVLRLLEPKAC